MRILIFEPGKNPRTADIPHSLDKMQAIVGGTIQAIYPWSERAALVCDDEGLLKDYRFNRLVRGNAIFGTFFICGIDECDFSDLPENLISRFSEELHDPQALVRIPSGYIALPTEVDDE